MAASHFSGPKACYCRLHPGCTDREIPSTLAMQGTRGPSHLLEIKRRRPETKVLDPWCPTKGLAGLFVFCRLNSVNLTNSSPLHEELLPMSVETNTQSDFLEADLN